MKLLSILLTLGLLCLHAVDLQWAHSYKEALSLAKKEKKNVMLLVTSARCGWCRKLESTTLKDKNVVERLNKKYILVHAMRGDETYPKTFNVGSVPASFFLDADGKLIIRKVVGYWSAEDYLSYMDDVDYKLGKKTY